MDLIDRGDNDFVCGDDILVLEGKERFVDVSGLDGHCENQLQTFTAHTLLRLTS
jgi:hypothetical protein